MAEYVIIGNGVAAVGCIEGIRSIERAVYGSYTGYKKSVQANVRCKLKRKR